MRSKQVLGYTIITSQGPLRWVHNGFPGERIVFASGDDAIDALTDMHNGEFPEARLKPTYTRHPNYVPAEGPPE